MSAEMTDPDPLQIIKKYGKAVVDEHLKRVRAKASDIKQAQWEIDQVLDTIDNRINSLSKGTRLAAPGGAGREGSKAYAFLREIIDQEAQALAPLDNILIAVNARDASAAYENTPSTIFDFARIQEEAAGYGNSPEALVDRMKALLDRQPTYLKEGKVRFREPRLKGKAEHEGAVINLFYTSAPGDNYLSLFDHDQTRAFLKNKGYLTAYRAVGR
jgi:hypothetical protein